MLKDAYMLVDACGTSLPPYHKPLAPCLPLHLPSCHKPSITLHPAIMPQTFHHAAPDITPPGSSLQVQNQLRTPSVALGSLAQPEVGSPAQPASASAVSPPLGVLDCCSARESSKRAQRLPVHAPPHARCACTTTAPARCVTTIGCACFCSSACACTTSCTLCMHHHCTTSQVQFHGGCQACTQHNTIQCSTTDLLMHHHMPYAYLKSAPPHDCRSTKDHCGGCQACMCIVCTNPVHIFYHIYAIFFGPPPTTLAGPPRIAPWRLPSMHVHC